MAAPRSPQVQVRWREGMLFEGGPQGRPTVLVDADGVTAISPVEMLLLAAATCSAADVVSILVKQRVALESLDIELQGTRRDEPPKRYTALRFHFIIAGSGADETKARRAIELSIEKYCSVIASLASDIPVTYEVTLR